MNILKIYQCPNCKSPNLLYYDLFIKCKACSLDFKINNGIIDFRNLNNDKTAGFDLNKDYEISKILVKIFSSIKYFNSTYNLYLKKLNSEKYCDKTLVIL